MASPHAAEAAGVVGTGTAASCTDAALDTALTGGGLVTFNCGGPATVDISIGTGTKAIAADTTIDGGGLITISGGNRVGVFSLSAGVNFTVENLTIVDGNANRGGGIASSGTLTVIKSTFSGNTAHLGGGVYSDGTLTVIGGTFTDNRAPGNYAGAGGIYSDGNLTVTNSTFTGNIAGVAGGGIYSDGNLTVTNSTFTGNIAESRRPSFPAGGGGIVGMDQLTVTNCTFSGNLGAYGGGILNLGQLTVTNSTFFANTAGFGVGISNFYEGVSSTQLTVTNSTFTDNSADLGGGAIHNDSYFGLDCPGAQCQATLRNTIVANSSDSNCAGSITDGGHNLDDGTSCGFSTINGSFNDTNPHLDPTGLQNNGGLTQTVALCTGLDEPLGCTATSPAVDGGDQAVCDAPPVNNRDQRGSVRPGVNHTNCSVGAYEADLAEPQATSAPTETAVPTFTATPTETPTVGMCTGDCDGNSIVAINELVLGVSIVLSQQATNACLAFTNSQGKVDIAQLVKGVNNALEGCSG